MISKDAQPGEMVRRCPRAVVTRAPVATIVDMDSREIEVDVNEAYVNRVHGAQRVQAVLELSQADPRHVIGIVPTADRQKATVKVRIAFDGLDPRILPDGRQGQLFDPGPWPGARARSRCPRRRSCATAMRRAMDRGRQQGVARGCGRARSATAGHGGLGSQGGDVVVVDPPKRLRDGATVKLKGA